MPARARIVLSTEVDGVRYEAVTTDFKHVAGAARILEIVAHPEREKARMDALLAKAAELGISVPDPADFSCPDAIRPDGNSTSNKQPARR